MSPLDLLRFVAEALSGQRLRAGLSVLGVTVGVAAVTVLTAVGAGAKGYVEQSFESLGSNILIVIPGKTETSGALPGVGGVPNDLTLDDAEAVRRQVPGLRHVVPVCVGTETASFRQRRRQTIVIGATPGLLPVRNLSLAAGQFLPEVDPERSVPVAVLGQTVARELFPAANPLGQPIRLGDRRLRVIGVLAPRGVHLGADLDDAVLIPVGTAMRLFDRSSLFRILVEQRQAVRGAGEGARNEALQRRLIAVLKERHDDEEDVTVLTQDAVVESLGGILNTLTLALAGIAGVSLAVAGLGIMNVMLVSVSERTSEVGLLRALGASQAQVVTLFLAEAVALSLGGGVAGLGLGSLGAWALRLALPDVPFAPPAWALAAALGVSLITGAVFGVLPALRAAQVDPVLALGKR